MEIASYLLDHGARVNAESKANLGFFSIIVCFWIRK